MVTTAFTRDRFTWLTYLMLGYYGYLLNGLGPVMPFLRSELALTYTESSLHFSAFAFGLILAGLMSHEVVRRVGRPGAFWLGASGMAVGAALLMVGLNAWVTVSAALIMGGLGSLLLVMIPATLADAHGDWRAVALSEANVISSLCGGLAPLVVGLTARTALGWRSALSLALGAMVVVAFVFRRTDFPKRIEPASHLAGGGPGRLPRVYWLYWVVLVLVVSVEFCIIFWGATFWRPKWAWPARMPLW